MYNRKRAVSPVIAVILLIGLAVAASAAIFLVILPLLEPTSSVDITEGYVIYDTEYTTALDEGQGYGKGLVNIINSGTGEVEITSIKIYWATSFAEDWTEITDATSTQGITVNNPWVLEPISGSGDDLTIRFPIPTENINDSLSYKIILTPNEGRNLDTSRTDLVDDTDMQLDADRPDISYTGSLGIIRRSSTISPNSVTDNSGIKNVTFEVFDEFSTLNETHTITSTSAWNWLWNTINSTAQGLDNGSYTMKMTVNDYAGLSDYVDDIAFTIDNDYVEPTIGGLWLTNPYSENQTAEVGESASFTVNINDTGTIGSARLDDLVATLYYRINASTDAYVPVNMAKYGVTSNWTASIPSSFVDSTALEEGIECYVKASDYDGNSANSSETLKNISVDDHFKPDISHIPTTDASVTDNFINITTTITDKDQVNQTLVRLYYRQTDDYGGATETWSSIAPLISGDEYFWLIWSADITIHGLDYYFNATDRFSGHVAYEGQEIAPHHITILDEQNPVITHTEISTATNDTALDIDCTIFDDDPTFGAEGSATGVLTLYYQDYDGGSDWHSKGMDWVSGNSSIDSNDETPSSTLWSATIPASEIESDTNPRLDYYIIAEDETSNSDQHGVPFHTAVVLPQGEPNIAYVANSMMVSGSIGEEIEFTVENVAGSGTDAKITGLNLTIFGGSTDYPILNMTQFESTTVWSNGTASNRNNTWITFTTNFTIVEGTTANITMTFENSTNQPYRMNGLNLKLLLQTYNIPQDEPSINSLDLNVQMGAVSMTKLLYMTYPTYSLSETGTTLSHTLTSPSERERNPPTIQLGIRVFSGTWEITNDVEAIVDLSTSWEEQQGYWSCPLVSLNPNNDIKIRIVALIDDGPGEPNEYEIAEFSTGTLGATELSSSVWEINYHGRYDWTNAGNGRENYWAEFAFGDTFTTDSFVDDFIYVTSG